LSFQVEGMSCGHCRSSVTAAIRTIEPTAKVDVDLQSGLVTVAPARDRAAIVEAIRKAGYETR
jgi:copper chaperone